MDLVVLISASMSARTFMLQYPMTNVAIFLNRGFLDKMIANKWLGNKTKGGYYKKVKDEKGKNVKMAIDWKTLEYHPAEKPKFASISAAKKKADDGVAAMMKIAFNGEDKAGEYVREYLCNNFIYSANRIPEICETIVGIDNAMKWGYNQQLGPFESWDAVGVKEAVEVMKKLGKKFPPRLKRCWLRNAHPSTEKKGWQQVLL